MAISRLFVEIGGDTSKLNLALRESIKTAEEAGVKITKAGQSFISAFNDALNPAKRYEEQLKLLMAAGKSQAEIWTVMGDKLKAAADATTKNGQVIPPLVKNFVDLNQTTTASNLSFETLGKTIADFARNPVEAAKKGVTSLLETLGPTAIGVGAVAAGVVAVGAAMFEFAKHASEEAEAMENLSALTGIGVQQLEAMKEMTEEAGLSSLDLGRTISKLNQELGKGEAPKEFKEGLDKLGISMKDASGKSKDAVTMLDEMREALLAVSDKTERAQLAQQVLGGRLRELIPLLLNSEMGIKDTTDAFIKQGVAVDELTHKRLMQFDSMLDQIGRNIGIAKNQLISMTMGVYDFLKSLASAVSPAGKNLDDGWVTWLLYGSEGIEMAKKQAAELDALQQRIADAIKNRTSGIVDLDAQYDINLKVLKATTEAEKINADHMKAQNDAAKKLREEGLKGLEEQLKSLNYYIQKQDQLGWDKIIKAARQEYELLAKTLPDLGVDIDAINKSLEDLGNLKPKGPDWTGVIVDGKESKKAIDGIFKQGADDWSKEVDRAFRKMAEGMAKSIVEWKGFWDTLKNIGKEFAEGILTLVFEKILDPFKQRIADLISGIMDKLMGGITSALGGLGSSAVGSAGGAVGAVGGAGGGAGSAVGSIGGAFTGWASGLISGGLSAIGSIVGSAMQSKDLGRIEENTRYTYMGIGGISGQGLIGLGFATINTLNTIVDQVSGVPDILWVIAERMSELKEAFQAVPAHAQGIAYVPKDGMAYLHEGERVVPRSQNMNYSNTYQTQSATVININGAIYGWNDFVAKVRDAGITLKRQGDPAWI